MASNTVVPNLNADLLDGLEASVFLQVTKAVSYTVAGVPNAGTSGAGTIIYVSNETGGATLAFSDGTNWRRCTDRIIIS